MTNDEPSEFMTKEWVEAFKNGEVPVPPGKTLSMGFMAWFPGEYFDAWGKKLGKHINASLEDVILPGHLFRRTP